MTEHRGLGRGTALACLAAALAAGTVQGQQRARSIGPSDAPPVTASFIDDQLTFPRVSRARAEKKATLEDRFARLGIPFPPAGVYIRVFKVERVVEVWVQSSGEARYRKLVTYPVCAVSGWLGPKRGQGDLQIPEGFYEVESFNPASDYHLSLRVNYPNQADRLAGMTAHSGLGGDIYLHGGCETIGCVPITDEHIRELYWLAVEARAAGVRRIPVHIFPTRLDDAGIDWLGSFFGGEPELMTFWQRMKEGYDFFQVERRVPASRAEPGGFYTVGDPAVLGEEAGLLGTPVESPPEEEPQTAPVARGLVVAAPRSSPPAGKGPPPVRLLGEPVDTAESEDPAPDSAAVDGAADSAAKADTPGAAAAEVPAPLPVPDTAAKEDRLLGEATPPAPDTASASPAGAEAGGLLGSPVVEEASDSAVEAVDGEPAARGARLLGRPKLLGAAIDGGPRPQASFIIPRRKSDAAEQPHHGIPWRVRVPRPVW